jgi:hypothetical protein
MKIGIQKSIGHFAFVCLFHKMPMKKGKENAQNSQQLYRPSLESNTNIYKIHFITDIFCGRNVLKKGL